MWLHACHIYRVQPLVIRISNVYCHLNKNATSFQVDFFILCKVVQFYEGPARFCLKSGFQAHNNYNKCQNYPATHLLLHSIVFQRERKLTKPIKNILNSRDIMNSDHEEDNKVLNTLPSGSGVLFLLLFVRLIQEGISTA